MQKGAGRKKKVKEREGVCKAKDKGETLRNKTCKGTVISVVPTADVNIEVRCATQDFGTVRNRKCRWVIQKASLPARQQITAKVGNI